MTFGVFGLNTVSKKQIENVVNNNFESWPEGATYGYFAGGFSFSTISRLDFFNETVSDPGNNLLSTIGGLAAISSNSYGYYGGGIDPTPSSINTISRLDFSNETVSDPGNNLPTSRSALAATSSNSYGYFGGGDAPPIINTITRLDFSNETVSDPGNNLPTARSNLAATTSNSYGYFGGGDAPPYINTISRLDFSNETVSDPGNNLPTARSALAATSSNSYGYYGGGDAPPIINTITRLDFTNETVSDPGNNLPTSRSALAATSSNSYGYFGGGDAPPIINTITRLDFSNETVSDPGNNLPTARSSMASVSGGASVYRSKGFKTYGYFAGGPTAISTISRLDFFNETLSDPGKNLPSGKDDLAVVSSNSYGYLGGGDPNTNVITRFDFSNETLNDPGKNLLLPTTQMGSVNSNNYGYFYGGFTPFPPFLPFAFYTTVTRLDFSSETLNNPGKNLLTPISSSSSVSTKSYGYIVWDKNPSFPSTQLKINYSNEVVSVASPLSPRGRGNTTSVQNNLYGYFCGGTTFPGGFPFTPIPYNTITRFDFSNEIFSNPGKNLPTTSSSRSGSSSSFYGYVNIGTTSKIVRIDFSTEDVSVTGTGFNPTRFDSTGFSNSN
jgi:hypothetical protein